MTKVSIINSKTAIKLVPIQMEVKVVILTKVNQVVTTSVKVRETKELVVKSRQLTMKVVPRTMRITTPRVTQMKMNNSPKKQILNSNNFKQDSKLTKADPTSNLLLIRLEVNKEIISNNNNRIIKAVVVNRDNLINKDHKIIPTLTHQVVKVQVVNKINNFSLTLVETIFSNQVFQI